jgi:hypothetical protein
LWVIESKMPRLPFGLVGADFDDREPLAPETYDLAGPGEASHRSQCRSTEV